MVIHGTSLAREWQKSTGWTLLQVKRPKQPKWNQPAFWTALRGGEERNCSMGC